MMGTEDDGVPLVADIYRKCASFFSEVDNMITLESFEYAENQLLVAGANAKQVCSKFMQVMLPDFLTDSSQDTRPSLEENENSEVPASEKLMSNKGHTNGQIISSNSSVGEDTLLAGHATDDCAGEKNFNQSPNVPIVNDSCIMVDVKVEQSTSKSSRAMDIEEKCKCVEVTGTEVHKASDCPRRKHQMQYVETQESETEVEDFCESDWEII